METKTFVGLGITKLNIRMDQSALGLIDTERITNLRRPPETKWIVLEACTLGGDDNDTVVAASADAVPSHTYNTRRIANSRPLVLVQATQFTP